MSDIKRKSDLETTYSKGQMRKDPFFGEHFAYNAIQGSSQIICVEKLFNDKESILREIEAKKKKILNKHPNILNLLDYSVEVQSNWCSTFYLLKLFYEWPEKTLKQAILERKSTPGPGGFFSLKEATNLLYHIVHACSFLQEKSVYHGDISPLTIFLTDKGEFKLAFRVNEQISSERVQIDKSIKNEPLYLSPTIFTAVKNRTLERSRHNPYKSDIFALGLSILEAGVLRSIQGIYGLNDNFDENAFEELLGEFEMKYEDNPLLYTSVRKMLEINEDERPDFIGLKSALPEYEVVKDYFYRLENGLIEDDEQENSGGLNGSFNNQNNQNDYYNGGYGNANNFQPNNDNYESGYRQSDSLGYNFYDEPQKQAMLQQGPYPPSSNQRFDNSQNNSFNHPNSNSNRSDRENSWNPPPLASPNVQPPNQKAFAFQNYTNANNTETYVQPETTKIVSKASHYDSDFFTTDYHTDISTQGNQTLDNTAHYNPYQQSIDANDNSHFNTYSAPQQTVNNNQAYQQQNNQNQFNAQTTPQVNKFNQQSAPQANQFGQQPTPQLNQFGQQPTPQMNQFGQPTTPQNNKFGPQAPQQTNQFNQYQQPQTSTPNQQGLFDFSNNQQIQPPAQQYNHQYPNTQPFNANNQQPAQTTPNRQYSNQQTFNTPQTPTNYQAVQSQQHAPPSQFNPISVPSSGGNTKMINGQLYNEVREEVNEMGPSGNMVKKIIIKYTLADNKAPTTVNTANRVNASPQVGNFGYGQHQPEPFFA